MAQNLRFPNSIWRVRTRTDRPNGPSIANKPPLARAARTPKGAQRRELSIPQGRGLIRQGTFFLRFFWSPPPDSGGGYWRVPYWMGLGGPRLEKGLRARSETFKLQTRTCLEPWVSQVTRGLLGCVPSWRQGATRSGGRGGRPSGTPAWRARPSSRPVARCERSVGVLKISRRRHFAAVYYP